MNSSSSQPSPQDAKANAGVSNNRNKTASHLSSSQRATEQAKKGEPLTANKKSDRSPKQENL